MTPQLWVSCQVQSHQHCWAQRWLCQRTGRIREGDQLLRDRDPCWEMGSLLRDGDQPLGWWGSAAQRWDLCSEMESLLRDGDPCSEMRIPAPAALGAVDRGGEQEFPPWVLSVLITTQPKECSPFCSSSFLGSPGSPRAHLNFAFCCGSVLPWAPSASCDHSRNDAGGEAELRSIPAPLPLQLGNPGKG